MTITQIIPYYDVFEWQPPPPRYCAACFVGFCDLEPLERYCYCCRNDHLSEEVEKCSPS